MVAQLAGLLPPAGAGGGAVLVNTDGWVKSLGLELLNQVLRITEPCVVLKCAADGAGAGRDDGVLLPPGCARDFVFRPPAEAGGAPKDVAGHLTRYPSLPKDQRTLRLLAHFLPPPSPPSPAARPASPSSSPCPRSGCRCRRGSRTCRRGRSCRRTGRRCARATPASCE
jgi:hypothetical protein